MLVKSAVGLPLFFLFLWWVRGPFGEDKLLYNASNAYLGIIPLTTYIYFRNLTPALRSHTMRLLHAIGKTTLETYLLQHHLWLTSNAKSLLVLVPRYPKINFLVVTTAYFWVSRKAYRLTMELRGMLLPDDLGFCLRSLAGMGGSMLACLLASIVMTAGGTEPAGMWCVAGVSLVAGFAVDAAVGRRMPEGQKPDEIKAVPKFLPHTAACAAWIVACSLATAYVGRYSAGPIMPLEYACAGAVTRGRFVELPCAEAARDGALRVEGMGSVAGCEGGPAWAWEETDVSTGCR